MYHTLYMTYHPQVLLLQRRRPPGRALQPLAARRGAASATRRADHAHGHPPGRAAVAQRETTGAPRGTWGEALEKCLFCWEKA